MIHKEEFLYCLPLGLHCDSFWRLRRQTPILWGFSL